MSKVVVDYGTGRRKSSIARVFLTKGSGKVVVNNKDVAEYFPVGSDWHKEAIAPLMVLAVSDRFDVKITVKGGGITGQSGAAKLGLARALERHELRTLGVSSIAELEDKTVERPWHIALRSAGMLTRDSRVVERKVPGLRKARKAKQFSKR